jgi:hypothetical protein
MELAALPSDGSLRHLHRQLHATASSATVIAGKCRWKSPQTVDEAKLQMEMLLPPPYTFELAARLLFAAQNDVSVILATFVDRTTSLSATSKTLVMMMAAPPVLYRALLWAVMVGFCLLAFYEPDDFTIVDRSTTNMVV